MYRDKELCCCLGDRFSATNLTRRGLSVAATVNPVRLPSASFPLSWPPPPPNSLHLPTCNLSRRHQKPLMFLASLCWPAHTGASLTGAVRSASPTLDPWRISRRRLRVRSLLSRLLLRTHVVRCARPDTHLTNFFFDGARADLLKALSVDPIFHVTHGFSLASQTTPSTYNFGALFANQQVRATARQRNVTWQGLNVV